MARLGALLLAAALGALLSFALLAAAVAILAVVMVLSMPETGVMLFLLYVPLDRKSTRLNSSHAT